MALAVEIGFSNYSKSYPDREAWLKELRRNWYRGENCNFHPKKGQLRSSQGLEKYILEGWTPDSPFISKKTNLLTFGSCFAEHISNYLSARGYKVLEAGKRGTVKFRAGVNNTFAIRQLFDWVYKNQLPKEHLWHDENKNLIRHGEKEKLAFSNAILPANVFIITLGLSEVWCNKQTGEVFWRAIPEDQFDPTVHGFRVSTVKENKGNLRYIYNLIKRYNPNAKVIFTISPVPLYATFRPNSCITSNSVSKAILRVAMDEFYREVDGYNDDSLFYWPSYEIISDYFADPYEEDNRHIRPDCVATIMEAFEDKYVVKNEKKGKGDRTKRAKKS